MTRRTAFAGSSAGRRRERRAHLQSDVSNSSEALHRPTPSRTLCCGCKRKPVDGEQGC
ncbi:transcriptional antitermination N peptide [Pantoea sp. LMR881]|uniref:transcriptional antitermination N peptide n=1 Tax=Pantoea sp. LMR881 TaxID=3014336 RepID=UPI003FA7AC64